MVVVAMLSGLSLLATGTLVVLADRILGEVQRAPGVFGGLADSSRPPQDRGVTFLLVGTDSGTARDYVPGAQRSDVTMLVHLDADSSAACVVSLPRDAWVDIPGHGPAKINAAHALGGPALLVRTVEALTDVRVDHFAVIDFAGFQALVDAVGGIDVSVAAPTVIGSVSFQAGVNHLDGREALAFVRQRKGLPEGDLSRVKRQQNVLRALAVKAYTGDTLAHPREGYRFLDTLNDWVTVDDTFDDDALWSLVAMLGELRPGDVTYLTAPVAGAGREGAQSVLYLDTRAAAELWYALSTSDVEGYAEKHPDSVLGVSSP